MNNTTKKEILARIANQEIGDWFYIGRIMIERVDEFTLLIGSGISAMEMSIPEFKSAMDGDFFAGVPLNHFDYWDAKFDQQFTQPDLQWSRA